MDNDLFKKIIEQKDTDRLLSLDDSLKEDFLQTLMYDHLCDIPLSEMNEVQKTLFLAMTLEDTCQADMLPSLSDNEEVFLSLKDIASAYERLGAPKTARCIREFISLLPENQVPEWSWFFDDERENIIGRLDKEISDYPDGLMTELYVKYISDRGTAERIFDNIP